VLIIRARRTIDTDLLPAVENPDNYIIDFVEVECKYQSSTSAEKVWNQIPLR
jgi:hypothetical protein